MLIGAALMIGLQVIIIEATESRGVQAFSFVEFFKVGSMVTAVNLAIYFAFIVLI
jgi:Na+/H+ antiporter NhaD/arsenite permease-like protein